MSLQAEPVVIATKSDLVEENVLHLEGGNVDSYPDPVKHGAGYEYVEFVNSRQKTPFERRLVWKIDLLIIPVLALIYFIAFVDRNSLGNARVMGLQKSVHMSDQGYYNCAQLFFVGYIIFMLPGNILLRWIPPNYQLGGSIICFGTLVASMGAAKNYQTVLALRMLIGFAQAFIQGTGVYGSLWWKRDEIATRGSIYYSAATLSGAFSGLIAYAISKNMTLAKTGREPWSWLFIIEGALGIVIGIVVVLILPNFPDKMKNGKNWLFSAEEIELAIHRVSAFNVRGSKLEWRQIFTALKDPKSWAFAFINGGIALALSSIGVFLPTFIRDFGYTAENAQLFSAIPYACAAVALPTTAIISDRINVKGQIIVLALTICSIGYIILLTVSSVPVKMVGTCFICAGAYTGVVLSVTWLAINTGGFTKRGTVWALAEVVGQCTSIMGSNVYTDKPRYIKGHSIVLAFLLFAIVMAVSLIFWMKHANSQKDRILADYANRGETHPHIGRSLEEEFDGHINFRYII